MGEGKRKEGKSKEGPSFLLFGCTIEEESELGGIMGQNGPLASMLEIFGPETLFV